MKNFADGILGSGAARQDVAEVPDAELQELRQKFPVRCGGSILLIGEPADKMRAVALALAQAVVCGSDGWAAGTFGCKHCSDCRKVREGKHPDVFWVAPRGAGSAIKIQDIRLLKERVGLKPYEASRKVSIVSEAERLTVESANALLKTLEEPPPDSVLIITASSVEQLLPTVVSRCALARVGTGQHPEGADDEEVGLWVQAWFDMSGAAQAIKWTDALVRRERRAVVRFLRELVCVYRDAAVLSHCGSAAVTLLSRQPRPRLRLWAEMLGPLTAAARVEEIMRVEELVQSNVNVKLAIDALSAIMPWREKGRTPRREAYS